MLHDVESVWDYPRPPRLEPTPKHLVVVLGGVTVADTKSAYRVLETSHPPVYYFPPDDVDLSLLTPSGHRSYCEWKGGTAYWNVTAGGKTAEDAAWSYPNPSPLAAAIKDHVAFYCGPMDLCLVDDEPARPQPGGFYGGWITDDLVGPFKGEPGTSNW